MGKKIEAIKRRIRRKRRLKMRREVSAVNAKKAVASTEISVIKLAIRAVMFIVMSIVVNQSAKKVLELSNGIEIMDKKFAHDMLSIQDTLLSLPINARAYYGSTYLLIDYAYMVVYALFFTYVIAYLISKLDINAKIVGAIKTFPIIAMIADWVEDLSTGLLIHRWPDIHEVYAKMFIVSNILKFVFLTFTIISIVALTGMIVYEKVSGKKLKV